LKGIKLLTKPNFSRDGFTWLAYLSLAFYSYFLNVLGPVTPFLKSELGLSYTVSSLHFSAFAVGMLLVGLGGHMLIERIGRRRSLWVGAFGMSLSVLLLLLGSIPFVTIAASFLMGLVGSLILAIIPAALAERHGELRSVAISEANVISSLLSTAAPLMVGWFAATIGGWRLGLALAASIPILLYFVFGKNTFPSSATAAGETSNPRQPLPLLFWVYWLAIVLAVSVEFCMISWSADYAENVFGLQKANAAQTVSLFLAAMIIGRMAGSRLVQYFSTIKLVNAFILLAGLGFLFFWKSSEIAQPGPITIVLGLGGLFVTGLGVASLYPLNLSLALGSAGINTVQASARAALASGTAILTLPLLLGRLADAFGIESAYGVVMPLLLALLLVLVVARMIRPTYKPV